MHVAVVLLYFTPLLSCMLLHVCKTEGDDRQDDRQDGVDSDIGYPVGILDLVLGLYWLNLKEKV